jgi:hypothetical protein
VQAAAKNGKAWQHRRSRRGQLGNGRIMGSSSQRC